MATSAPPPPAPNHHQARPPGAPANGAGGPPPSGDSYFTESRKGEVNELRQLLRTFGREKDVKRRREIIKKVIAYMTLGIDVSRLFTEMMLAIETRDLVVKKMVYLFLCNYATTHPDLAQMCTNTLQKDCGNEDPMVRGLALRALCGLRLPQMVEYISEPLRRSLTDGHAYVRKTGVMGILKLWHLDKEAFERCDFVDILYDMLRDPDASVVSNCILVLNEIMARGPNGGMAINRQVMLHLLNRVHEFSEFGICAVLDLVPRYRPRDDDEAYQIMNLLDPVLRTSNSAAVMATVRAFLAMSEQVNGGRDKEGMMRQVAARVRAPVVTLVTGANAELRHCLLAHVLRLVEICPGVFDDEYRQFYPRHNEPTHAQYLKIRVLPRLANADNVDDVLAELGAHAASTDASLSRLAVRGLADVARGGDAGAEERVAARLVEMLDLDVGHVPSEAAVALADVVRRRPRLGAIVAARVPRALRYVDEPRGRVAALWLLGEVARDAPEAPYALERLIDDHARLRRQPGVVSALLTATLKLFFERPPEVHRMLGKLLADATEDVSDQDAHDRALFYYRLLRTDIKAAERAVKSVDSTVPSRFAEEDDFSAKNELMKEFNTLSMIYGETSDQFVAEEYRVKHVLMPEEHAKDDHEHEAVPAAEPEAAPAASVEDLTGNMGETSLLDPTPVAPAPAPAPAPGGVADLLDFMDGPPAAAPTPAPVTALTLQPNVSMTGDEYQALWSSIETEAASVAVPTNTSSGGAPTTAAVEAALRDVGVSTMASGELPTELKFFLYCKDADDDVYLLQTSVAKPPAPAETTMVVKTSRATDDRGDRVEQVTAVVRRALRTL